MYSHFGLTRIAFALLLLFVAACRSGAPGEPTAAVNGDTVCEDGAMKCADPQAVNACKDNAWVRVSCQDMCAEAGFTPSGCDGDVCRCGGFLDQDCARGLVAMCTCLDWPGTVCSDDRFLALYRACFSGEVAGELAKCALGHADGDSVDCKAVVTHCKG